MSSEPPGLDPKIVRFPPRDRAPAKRIVVSPDDVLQPDRRPWRETSFGQALFPFLLVSAVIVAIGVIALVLGLRLAL
jgi:hypothetical protein